MFKTFKSALIVASVTAVETTERVEVGKDFPTKAVGNFAAGIFFEFMKENTLPEIKKCFGAMYTVYPHLARAWVDEETGNPSGALEELKELANVMPDVIDVCKDTSEDFAALGKWIDQFDSLATAKAIVTKNFKDNKFDIL